MNDFDKKLRKVLKKRNISQSQLAKGVNLSRSAISHYVNGNAVPTHNNIVMISDYLKVPINYFLNDNEDKKDIDDKNKIQPNKLHNEIIDILIKLTLSNKISWSSKAGSSEKINPDDFFVYSVVNNSLYEFVHYKKGVHSPKGVYILTIDIKGSDNEDIIYNNEKLEELKFAVLSSIKEGSDLTQELSELKKLLKEDN